MNTNNRTPAQVVTHGTARQPTVTPDLDRATHISTTATSDHDFNVTAWTHTERMAQGLSTVVVDDATIAHLRTLLAPVVAMREAEAAA